MASPEGRRATTLRDLRTRMDRTLQVLQRKPSRKGGRSLMRAYAEQHFQDCPVGGVGRKRQLLDVEALLRFIVIRAGASDRWMPPSSELIEELIGHSDRSHEDCTPIKPEQLAALARSQVCWRRRRQPSSPPANLIVAGQPLPPMAISGCSTAVHGTATRSIAVLFLSVILLE
jgi:hypothetical protein